MLSNRLSIAEEVRDASRSLPVAMVWTLIVNGITGFVMSVTFAYCLGPLDVAVQPPYFFAFVGTFYNATQSHAGATVMSCIITIMTLCSAITNVATGSRQMFAFARDNGLPFSGFLSYVRTHCPLVRMYTLTGWHSIGSPWMGHTPKRRPSLVHNRSPTLTYQSRQQRNISSNPLDRGREPPDFVPRFDLLHPAQAYTESAST